MAKNITSFVKSIGANKVAAEMKERTQCYWDFIPRNTFHDDRSCSYFNHERFFCVPDNISCARFEIWGAGGAANGGCNCMYSPPSGSGAYARITIPVTQGECYRVHVGWNWCCTNPAGGGDNTTHSGYCNNNNRHTWVIGSGLTNFCAEHGCSSRTCCCNTAAWATNCAKYQNDSDNAGARFFGADEGVRGKIGFLELVDSASDPTDYFQYRPWVPFPGGLWNKYGGHVLWNYHEHHLNVCCTSDWADGGMGSLFGYGSNGPRGSGRYAGWGMPGIPFCGGSLGCGAYANSGRVRISYSCANTFED